MSVGLSPFVLRSHEGLTLKASAFEGFPATNLHNRQCRRFKLNLNFVVISQVAVKTNYRCCLIEITLVMFQNASKFTRRTVLKLLSNFYWVEKIISRFWKEFHFVDWFAIVLYYTHNLTLYIFLFHCRHHPGLHDEHWNIETLLSNIRFTERESALKRKGGSQKCDTVSPGRAKPETCFIRKMYGTWYKTCLLYGNFSDAPLICFKRGNSLKDMLVRAKLSRSQRRQIRYQSLNRWGIVKPCQSVLTWLRTRWICLEKFRFRICFNFVAEFRRYLTPQCSCLMEKNQCILSLSKGGWFFLNTCM